MLSAQRFKAANEAMTILRMMKRSFHSLDIGCQSTRHMTNSSHVMS